jgi:hypothetical protein
MRAAAVNGGVLTSPCNHTRGFAGRAFATSEFYIGYGMAAIASIRDSATDLRADVDPTGKRVMQPPCARQGP